MGKMDPSFTMKVENTAGFDFNLLRALAVLIEESSVTRAADRLGVSQPAMSRTLGRLRESLGDNLLMRTGRGMRLTPRGEAIRGPVRRLMADVQALIHTEPLFEPATAEARFVLAVDPCAQCTIVPEIVSAVAGIAPGVDLRVKHLSSTVDATLLCGEADLVIGPSNASDDGELRRRNLIEDTFVCMVRRNHPGIDRLGRLPGLADHRRARVASAGWWGGMVETALHENGHAGRVRVVLPDLMAAPFILASTDLVLVLPKSVGQQLVRMHDVVLVEPPCDMPTYRLAAFWHAEQQQDPGHRWFRRLIADTVATASA
jgi:DNA-binding transcriptional LysR family regulator